MLRMVCFKITHLRIQAAVICFAFTVLISQLPGYPYE